MKKMYFILGNKPFEDKLAEELSSNYRLVGSSDTVDAHTVDELITLSADALIVRESLAENTKEFLGFLHDSMANNKNLKIVAILQQRNVGDEVLFQLAQTGIFDIINGGTRLADVIAISTREPQIENVLPYLTEIQQERLLNADKQRHAADTNVEMDVIEDIDVSIDIDGELQVEGERHKSSFKERYMSGITQVYAAINEDEDETDQAPAIEHNELVQREGKNPSVGECDNYDFRLPGYHQKGTENESQTYASTPTKSHIEVAPIQPAKVEPVAAPLKTPNIPEHPRVTPSIPEPIAPKTNYNPMPANQKPRIILYVVAHSLMSSVAMQYAVAIAPKRKVAYIESMDKNKSLKASCEKHGVKFVQVDNTSDVGPMVAMLQNEAYHDIIINSCDVTILGKFLTDRIYYEITQDKWEAEAARKTLAAFSNVHLLVTYFEPDLVSIKTLSKVLNCPVLRWSNTRIEEYNSRLNSKLLHNETVAELVKEG